MTFVGMNLTSPSFFVPDMPFIDRMKVGGDWAAGTPVSPDGWPLAGANGTTSTQCAVPMSDVLTPYVIRWEGSGTVRPGFNNIGGVLTGKEYRVTTARNVGATSNQIMISGINPADPPRNITVVPAALDALFQAGELFDPDYVESLRGFKTIRFMDWLRTNGSTLTTAGPSNAPIRSWGKGVPLAVCIALAEKVGAQGWCPIPEMATDDAIREFGTMMPPGWPIEYSNEVWNTDFDQGARARAAGGGTVSGHAAYVGGKMAAVAKVLAEVGRTLTVGWQPTVNPNGWDVWEAAFVAANPPPANVMTSCYITGGLNSLAAITPYMQADDVAGVHAKLLAEVPACRTRFINARAVATRLGGTWSVYEGNIHLNTSPGVDTAVPFVAKVQRDPGIRPVFEGMLAEAENENVAAFCAFNHSSAPSRNGYFGVRDTPFGTLLDEMRLASEAIITPPAGIVTLSLSAAASVSVDSAATPQPAPDYEAETDRGHLMNATPSRIIYGENAVHPAWPAKYPSEILDYGYMPDLQDGETVALAQANTWEGGPTIERLEYFDDGVKLWISGGTGSTYGAIEIAIETVTAAGAERQILAEIELRIRQPARAAPTLTGVLRGRGSFGLDVAASIVNFVPTRVQLSGGFETTITATGQLRSLAPNLLQGTSAIALTISGGLSLRTSLAGDVTLALTPVAFATNTAAGQSPLIGAVTLSIASSAAIATARALVGAATISIVPTGAPLILDTSTPVYRTQNTRTYGSSTYRSFRTNDTVNIRDNEVPPQFVGTTFQSRAAALVPSPTGKTITSVNIGSDPDQPDATFGPSIRYRIQQDIANGLLTVDTKVIYGNGNASPVNEDDLSMWTHDRGMTEDMIAAGIKKIALGTTQYKPEEIASQGSVQIFNRRQSWFRANSGPYRGLFNLHEAHLRTLDDAEVAAYMLPDDLAQIRAGRRADSLVSADNSHDIGTGYRVLGNYVAKVERGFEGGVPFIGSLDYLVRTVSPGFLCNVDYIGDLTGCTVSVDHPDLTIAIADDPAYPAASIWPKRLRLSAPTTLPLQVRLPVNITITKAGVGTERFRIFLSISERVDGVTAPYIKRFRDGVEWRRTNPYGNPNVAPAPYFPANTRKLSFCFILKMEADTGNDVYGNPANGDEGRSQYIMSYAADGKALIVIRRTASTAINVTIYDDTNGGSGIAINAGIPAAFGKDHGWRAFFLSYDADQPNKCGVYCSAGKRISGPAYAFASAAIVPGGTGGLGLARPSTSLTDGLYMWTNSVRYVGSYFQGQIWNVWWAHDFLDFSIAENRALLFDEATQRAVDPGNLDGTIAGIKPFIYMPNTAAETICGFMDRAPEHREGGVSVRNFGTHPNGEPAPGFAARVVGSVERVLPAPGILFGRTTLALSSTASPTNSSPAIVLLSGAATLAVLPAATPTNTPPLDVNLFGTSSLAIVPAATITYTAPENPGATAVMARMSPAPSSARRVAINTLYSEIEAAGVFAVVDRLVVLAAHSEAAARIDWKATTKSLTPFGNVEAGFVADRGYIGDGVGAYLSFGDAITTFTSFTRDAGSFGAWMLSAPASLTRFMGMVENTGIYLRNSVSQVNGIFNAGATATFSAPGTGLISAVRPDNTGFKLLRNGVSLGTTASTPSTPAGTPALLRGGGVYSPDRMAFAFIGGAMSDAMSLALFNAVDKYLRNVGAIT